MYAVIETGGKQYRVELGTELEVELLDVEAGQSITLDRVLLVADGDDASIGQPLVANASVEAEVVRQARGEKVIAFKYRPKARRRVKKGHRQELTVLRVTDVVLDGKSAAESARKADQDAKTERERLAEAAARQAAEDARLAAKLAAAKPAPSAEGKAKPKARRGKAAADEGPADDAEASAATDQDESPAADTEAKATTDAKAAADQAADAPAEGEAEATGESADAEPAETTDTPAEAPKRSRTKKSE